MEVAAFYKSTIYFCPLLSYSKTTSHVLLEHLLVVAHHFARGAI
jgi:hypothetical protein